MRTRPSKRARLAAREVNITEAFGNINAVNAQIERVRNYKFVPSMDFDALLIHQAMFGNAGGFSTYASPRPLHKQVGINLNVSAPMPTLESM